MKLSAQIGGNGPYVTTTARLLEVYRYFKDHPDGQIETGMWTEPTWNREQFIAWFRRCLMTKINARDPFAVTVDQARKCGDEYQTELFRMKRYVGNRAVIDWIAPVLGLRVRAAFEHRLRDPL